MTGDPHASESFASSEPELRALESFALSTDELSTTDEDVFVQRAAVLRGNAMGIIYDGDGSDHAEKVQRMLMLVPALLTVVDEARDTIGRLRDTEESALTPRIFVRGTAQQVRTVIGRAPYQAAAVGAGCTWRLREVSTGIAEVSLHRVTNRPQPPAEPATDLVWVLSELKSEVETGRRFPGAG